MMMTMMMMMMMMMTMMMMMMMMMMFVNLEGPKTTGWHSSIESLLYNKRGSTTPVGTVDNQITSGGGSQI
jgi:hypothetical protein